MLQCILECIHLFELVLLFYLGKYPKVGLLDCLVSQFLNSFERVITVSIVAIPTYVPMKSAQYFPFCYMLISIFNLLPFHSKQFL